MKSHHPSSSHESFSERHHKILLFFMVLFALGFIVSFGFFIKKIYDVKHRGPLHMHNPLGMIFSGSRDIFSESGTLETDRIEPWMTFAYINFRFHLSPDILREGLAIDDKKYPNIPLSRYAKKKNLDTSVVIEKVRDIIRTTPVLTTPFSPNPPL